RLANETVSDYYWGLWLPDGKRIIFTGVEPGHGPRVYLQGTDGGKSHPITPEGTILPLCEHTLSHDGIRFVAVGPDHKAVLCSIEGGEPRPIPGVDAWDVPIRFSRDSHTLYVARLEEFPVKVYQLDLGTGRRQLWKEILPSDPDGLVSLYALQLGDDGNSYFYSYWRNLSDLYLVDGLK
ncbi:MAG: hypothetical protein WAU32_14060, partial [Thermoanaerobaculia bacterium]